MRHLTRLPMRCWSMVLGLVTGNSIPRPFAMEVEVGRAGSEARKQRIAGMRGKGEELLLFAGHNANIVESFNGAVAKVVSGLAKNDPESIRSLVE